jgi:hypothetical protein
MTIEDIAQHCKLGSVRWTHHALERMEQRNIRSDDVLNALTNGEIIEQYPSDYPFPSCLVLGFTIAGQSLHIVCGLNELELWIISVYFPNSFKWQDGFKQRRNP